MGRMPHVHNTWWGVCHNHWHLSFENGPYKDHSKQRIALPLALFPEAFVLPDQE